ncbi:PIN domain-containing protein [Ornithinimicrobium ciconiae]|nr:PIN domain-containing protein [Ornithinimicrobium ciconiae]
MGGLPVMRVLVDANVFYSRTVRDWLGLMYTTPEVEPFLVCWTEDIMAELLYHLRKNHPGWNGGRIVAVRDQICGTFEAGRVRDYAGTNESVRDPGDAHVAAAAIACGADMLLTFDVDDFVSSDELPYEVWTPDDFFVLVNESSPSLIASCVEKQIQYWSRKREDVDLVEMLQRAHCPKFADVILGHLRDIAHQR